MNELELMDEIVFGGAAGRRPGAAVSIEVERGLRPDEVDDIAASRGKAPTQSIGQLKHAHHQLARLIAKGYDNFEVSAMTGYNPAYVSRLKTDDPAFRELLAHYSAERSVIHTDAVERMATVGVMALDEMQQRLTDDPAGWSNRELMELSDLTLVKPMQALRSAAGTAAGAAPVTVNVKFVGGPAQHPGPTIDLDLEPNDDN